MCKISNHMQQSHSMQFLVHESTHDCHESTHEIESCCYLVSAESTHYIMSRPMSHESTHDCHESTHRGFSGFLSRVCLGFRSGFIHSYMFLPTRKHSCSSENPRETLASSPPLNPSSFLGFLGRFLGIFSGFSWIAAKGIVHHHF